MEMLVLEEALEMYARNAVVRSSEISADKERAFRQLHRGIALDLSKRIETRELFHEHA